MSRSTYIYTLEYDLDGKDEFSLYGHYTVKKEALSDAVALEYADKPYPSVRLYRSLDGRSTKPKERVLVYDTSHL